MWKNSHLQQNIDKQLLCSLYPIFVYILFDAKVEYGFWVFPGGYM